MTNTILIINAGSSSLKFSIYGNKKHLPLLYTGQIYNILDNPHFTVADDEEKILTSGEIKLTRKSPALFLMEWLEKNLTGINIVAAGHRIVHGGRQFISPIILNNRIIDKLEELSTLAPLHQPHNISAVKAVIEEYPKLKQVGCFDTSFHRTQPEIAQNFAIPNKYTREGIIRYGFHGLSYEYIMQILPGYVGKKAYGRVIVAHLGNGASMCAIKQKKSVATTMGFTALDGLMMGTRSGAIDPGILLHFLNEKAMSAEKLSEMLYEKSGLLGVSEISNDMNTLEESEDYNAKNAIELFCYRAAREIGSLAAALQGLDVLVFTAGIGEHSALVRKKICGMSAWLGVKIDAKRNSRNQPIISSQGSKIRVLVLPTDEQKVIAMHTYKLLRGKK